MGSQIYNNAEFGSLRTTVIDGEPFFVGKDIATLLGYSNPRDAINKHVDDDKGVKCDTPGAIQNLTIINESVLYSLILHSQLPKAGHFKRWVTSEVLPSIRRHGMYATDELVLMGKCQEVWVLSEKITKGMVAEIELANKRH